MANIRVKDLPNTNSAADTDEFIIDSSTAGTRRLSYSELKSEISTDFQGDVNTYKIATLASDNKLDPSQIPDTLSQGLNFVGVANSASDLTSTTQGDFYVIQTAFDSYQVGDQAVYDGSAYIRVTDGTKEISEGGTGATTLDEAKTNLEIIDVGTGPQEVPLNSMLSGMAYMSPDSVSVDTLEVTDKVDGSLGVGVAPSTTVHLKSADPVIRLEDSSPDGVYGQIDGAGGSLILTADGGNGAGSSAIKLRVDGATAASDKVTIDSTGVGIGTASPGSYNGDADDLVVGAAGTGNRGLTIASGSANYGVIYFADGTTGNQQYRGAIGYNHNSDSLSLSTSGTTRWSIGAGGVLLGAAGNGIRFDTGTTLDSYEEGTFTPVFADDATGGNTATVTDAEGVYVKIGRVVNFCILLTNIDTTGLTSGNTARVRGLPFDVGQTSVRWESTVRLDNATFTGYVTATGNTNNDVLSLNASRSGTTDAGLAVSAFTSGSADVFITGTYQVG